MADCLVLHGRATFLYLSVLEKWAKERMPTCLPFGPPGIPGYLRSRYHETR